MTTDKSTPLSSYDRELARRAFSDDPGQRRAVQYLENLHDQLIAEHERRRSLAARLRRSVLGWRPASFRGLYLWGGVGRGKTWLVDSFFRCLPFEEKLRIHFHRFMRHVHGELRELKDTQEPLQIVADRLAARSLVVCLDEFHVSDITDAMLLGGLLSALFDRGVTLVATSNEHPDELYRGGLQRERFLPAIAMLKRHAHVVHLDGGVDYRMRYLDHARIYHSPLDRDADGELARHFEHIAPEPGTRGQALRIEGRDIPTVRCADGVVWFDFPAICDGPRGPSDYIEIARMYQTVLIGNVPRMTDEHNDAARRFITLVDEFYDRNVRLILSAETGPAALYQGRRLEAPFRRTASRLVEMQSRTYLSREHRPD